MVGGRGMGWSVNHSAVPVIEEAVLHHLPVLNDVKELVKHGRQDLIAGGETNRGAIHFDIVVGSPGQGARPRRAPTLPQFPNDHRKAPGSLNGFSGSPITDRQTIPVTVSLGA